MRTEIRICGFGGQGVILAGIILGKSASLFDNKEADGNAATSVNQNQGTTSVVNSQAID